MAAISPELHAVAQTLATDVATGEVVQALGARGIPSIVLRGPAIARLLYDDHSRTYVDADLLVPPSAWREAGAVLSALGFAPLVEEHELAGHRPVHAFEWWRRTDHVAVDLHRTVSGAGVAHEEVWRLLAADTTQLRVGAVDVSVPSPRSLALLVTLHTAHHGPGHRKALADLERALERLDETTWRSAAALAEALDAVPALAAGLRLLPAGRRLAQTLELGEGLPTEVLLRSAGSPPLALGIEWLLEQKGIRAKAHLVAHVLVPPPGALRAWRPLARAGRSGLALAYITQPFWLARHALPSARAVARARRAAS